MASTQFSQLVEDPLVKKGLKEVLKRAIFNSNMAMMVTLYKGSHQTEFEKKEVLN
jgi:hypothetical protein